jgi:hypothetical protein
MKYVLSNRGLRNVLIQVDKQRVVGIITSKVPSIRPVPKVEYGIPYGDEKFMCGLLTCEFRGWVERFGDEVPITNMTTGAVTDQSLFRVTQAGRAVLDRTTAVSNIALVIAIASLISSVLAFWVSQHSGFQSPHIPGPLAQAPSQLPTVKSPGH